MTSTPKGSGSLLGTAATEAVTSILMNSDTYEVYAAWGTNTFPNGERIRRRQPKDPARSHRGGTTHLSRCLSAFRWTPATSWTGEDPSRIPLDVAAVCLSIAEQHVGPLANDAAADRSIRGYSAQPNFGRLNSSAADVDQLNIDLDGRVSGRMAGCPR